MKNTLSTTGSRASPDTVKELQRLGGGLREGQGRRRRSRRSSSTSAATTPPNTLRELATVWHKEAQKTNNKDTYALAQYLYKEYLTRFPKEKDVYQMTFYYAELLFKLGSNGDNQQYCDAAPIYTKVVKLDPQPTAKYLKDAAYAAVISWKNCLSVDDSGAATRKRRHERRSASEMKDGGKKRQGEGRGRRDARSSRSRSPRTSRRCSRPSIRTSSTCPIRRSCRPSSIARRASTTSTTTSTRRCRCSRTSPSTTTTSELALYSTNLLFDCLDLPEEVRRAAGARSTSTARCTRRRTRRSKAQCAQLKSAARP